jgi:hypothetical protein
MVERCAIRVTSVRCEREEGSSPEVRGFRNFELRVALFSLVSFESDMVITAEAFMNMFGIGLARA